MTELEARIFSGQWTDGDRQWLGMLSDCFADVALPDFMDVGMDEDRVLRLVNLLAMAARARAE